MDAVSVNPATPVNPVSTAGRIHELERNVALADVGLAGATLVIGYLVMKRLYWGVPVGVILGFASFHLLVAQVSRLNAGAGWAVGSVAVLSSLKLAGLFLIVLGLYAVQAVDLVQVLIGLLLSQFGVAGGIGWELRRSPILPAAGGACKEA